MVGPPVLGNAGEVGFSCYNNCDRCTDDMQWAGSRMLFVLHGKVSQKKIFLPELPTALRWPLTLVNGLWHPPSLIVYEYLSDFTVIWIMTSGKWFSGTKSPVTKALTWKSRLSVPGKMAREGHLRTWGEQSELGCRVPFASVSQYPDCAWENSTQNLIFVTLSPYVNMFASPR